MRTLLLFLLGVTLFGAARGQSHYNDGGIYLKVWVHKVWSSADCFEDYNPFSSGADPVFKDIRVRVPNPSGGFYYSLGGLSLSYDSKGSHKWWQVNQASSVQSGGAPLESANIKGYKIFDRVFPGTDAPTGFEWRVGEIYEKDACGGDFTYRDFQPNPFGSNFCLDGDDYRVLGSWSPSVNPFRSIAPGTVGYIQTDVLDAGGDRDDRYSVIYAVEWGWVDPLPPLCPSWIVGGVGQTYQDGPVTLTVKAKALWADTDYDFGICGIGFAGSEELRVRYKAKDNLLAWPGNWISLPNLSQSIPGWNFWGSGAPGTGATIFTRTYSAGQLGALQTNMQFQLWEDDCGADNLFEDPCGPFNSMEDDNFLQIGKDFDWRSSPPNTWNYLDIPLQNATAQYKNYTIWIEYMWTIGNPTATIANSGTFGPGGNRFNRLLCTGQTTTITANTQSATYFQWQVADRTGSSTNGTCPSGAEWTDIPGAICPTYTPPQVPGTRVYRLKVMNRSGSGSTSATGDRLAYGYSECVNVTYAPFISDIASTACGGAFSPVPRSIFPWSPRRPLTRSSIPRMWSGR